MAAAALRPDPDLLSIEAGPATIAGAGPRVTYRLAGVDRELAALGHPSLERTADGALTVSDGVVELQVRAAAVDAGHVVTARVVNLAEAPLRLDEVVVLEAIGPGALSLGSGDTRWWSVLRNGWNSWSLVRRFRFHEVDRDPLLPMVRMTAVDPGTPRTGPAGELRSEQFTAVSDLRTGDAVVIGFLGGARALSVIDLAATPAGDMARLAATCRFDGAEVAPGEAVESEALLVAGGTDAEALLGRWADDTGAAMGARVPARPPSGWCSWYYYFAGVTEAAVRENLAAMERVESRLPLDYVMVDDGHQQAIGDWLVTNGDFPSGMAAVGEAIRATGRDAGIWIAPFIVDPRSSVATANPEWLLRRGDGTPVRALWNPVWSRTRFMLTLDCSRDDVQDWLEHTAHVIAHEWGYRVLKLDFCYAAALPGERTDPASTRASALRSGLDAIRRGAGDDAFLLGCGLPLGPAVGVVDGMRIGPDVGPYWNFEAMRWATNDTAGATTEGAIRSTLNRAFMHGRLWANDPDCLMVREDRTRMTEAEVRSLVAVVGLTDGMPVVSDNVLKVPDDRLDLLRMIGLLAGGRCRVVDLFDRAMPELVVSEHDDATFVGVFNFGPRPRTVVVDLAVLGLPDGAATEVFSGAAVAVSGGSADLGTIDRHDCRVLRVDRP